VVFESPSGVVGDLVMTTMLHFGNHDWCMEIFMSDAAVDEIDDGASGVVLFTGVVITTAICLALVGVPLFVYREETRVAVAVIVATKKAHQNVLSYVCHEMRNPVHGKVMCVGMSCVRCCVLRAPRAIL